VIRLPAEAGVVRCHLVQPLASSGFLRVECTPKVGLLPRAPSPAAAVTAAGGGSQMTALRGLPGGVSSR
jgi:hypothetical protein